MINKSLSKCPVCDEDLAVTRLYCVNCNTTIEGHFVAEHTPFGHLSPEQMQFLLTFVRCEGRLNRMEDEMKLSYPTLRSRLNEIVRALGYEPGKEETPLQLSPEDRRSILEELDQGIISWDEAQARLRGEKYVESKTVSSQEEK
ncbi:MAG: hypothetical protein FD147_283 [Chloroflexi bacterium]|nr:MAG: hypothetical protein FD147_283 [Chloroflexota bacterium]MBA4375261.1 hypothetical protein [Anaerolinea sp.]